MQRGARPRQARTSTATAARRTVLRLQNDARLEDHRPAPGANDLAHFRDSDELVVDSAERDEIPDLERLALRLHHNRVSLHQLSFLRAVDDDAFKRQLDSIHRAEMRGGEDRIR